MGEERIQPGGQPKSRLFYLYLKAPGKAGRKIGILLGLVRGLRRYPSPPGATGKCEEGSQWLCVKPVKSHDFCALSTQQGSGVGKSGEGLVFFTQISSAAGKTEGLNCGRPQVGHCPHGSRESGFRGDRGFSSATGVGGCVKVSVLSQY